MDERNIISHIKELDLLIIKKMMKGKDIKKHPSPTQIKIINYMFEHRSEKIYQKDIENYLKLSRATISDVLKTMEKNGYIKKITCAEDARTNKIVLNDVTLEMYKKVMNEIKQINDVLKYNISEEDMNTFVNVVEQMKENIKNN
ncbi:MAG: MarR family transcriptional regulator [Bacilli bacterium]|nr:MarR family transcriptional regulator [Bacilli bacterium]